MGEFTDPLISKLREAEVHNGLIAQVDRRLKDDLTGLPKWETGREFINQALSEGKNVVVEMVDLRFLKTFNKRIGYTRTDDEVLKQIGDAYSLKIKEFRERGVDAIAIRRYAGDEFMVVVVGKTKRESKPILDEIYNTLRTIKKPKGAFFKPHFSRGIVSSQEIPEDKRDTKALVTWAERRVTGDREKKLKYIQKRAKRKENAATGKLLAKIQRYV